VGQVTIYTKPGCPYCAAAKADMEQRGIQYIEHNVQADKVALKRMLELNGGRRSPAFCGGLPACHFGPEGDRQVGVTPRGVGGGGDQWFHGLVAQKGGISDPGAVGDVRAQRDRHSSREAGARRQGQRPPQQRGPA